MIEREWAFVAWTRFLRPGYPERQRRILKFTGFMLTELMLALSLTLLLMSVLLGLYLSSQRADEIRNALYTIQNNGNAVAAILRREIKQAGYIGCPRLTSQFPLANYPPYDLRIDNKIQGSAQEITFRHAANLGTNLAAAAKSGASSIYSSSSHYKRQDVLLISDCAHAEIVIAKAVLSGGTWQKIILTKPMQFSFAPNAEINRFEMNKYYVADSKQVKGQQSLYQEDIHQRKTELVLGIERLRFSYLFDQELVGIAVEYETVASITKKTWYLFAAVGGVR